MGHENLLKRTTTNNIHSETRLDVQKLIDLCDDYVSGRRQFVGKPEEETKQHLIEPFLANLLGWPSTHSQSYYDR